MSETTSLSKRLLPFDGMRGIAAVGVAAFHVNPSSPFLFWAWTFVDMFFVLSGFLIGSILYRGMTDGTLSLKNFWIRRILRIWPVYYLTLAVVVTAALVSSTHVIALKELTKTLFFLQFTGAYLHPGASWDAMWQSFIPSFGHSWSIAAEEQFYLLLPVLLWLFGVSARGIFLLVAMMLALGQLLLCADFVPGLLGTRMQGMALGLLLVPLSHWLQFKSVGLGRRQAALGILGVAAFIGVCIMTPIFMQVAPALWHGTTVGPEEGRGFVHASVLGMALIFFGLAGFVIAYPQGFFARALSGQFLVYLGSISYATYMFHIPIKDLLVSMFGQQQVVNNSEFYVLYWAMIFGCAHLSKILIENRFNALKDRYPVYVRPEVYAAAPT